MSYLRNLFSALNGRNLHFRRIIRDETILSFSRLHLLSRTFSSSPNNKKVPKVTITLEKEDGSKITAKCEAGSNLRDVIASHSKEFGETYGVCDGTLSCSTCHVIFNQEDFNKIPNEHNDEEMDILDMAPNCTPTSRLACAITIMPELEGMSVKIPDVRKDARSLTTDD